MYAVFETYYKYGDTSMEIIPDDETMKAFCFEKLIEYDVH